MDDDRLAGVEKDGVAGSLTDDVTNLNVESWLQDQCTIFDRLNEAGKSWKIYYYDFPSSLILTNQRDPKNIKNYFYIDEFFIDARGEESGFPAFTFIEPKYFDVDQNDDHPPHNVMKAQKLIADVYNAIRSNMNLWRSTLLVVVYDEHGGFYDHVVPPGCVAPDQHTEEYTFDQLGVRVPAILISPWVGRGVEKTQFNHTSLLKYLIDKWQLGPLGNRTATANSIALCLNKTVRDDSVPFIRVPNAELIPLKPELEKWDFNFHHEAIYNMAKLLAMKYGINFMESNYTIWSRFKGQIGKILIQIGKWFEEDLNSERKNRINNIRDVVEQLLVKR